MPETEREEKTLKKLEKLKKAELIEHIISMSSENEHTTTQLMEVLEKLSFANQRVKELEEELKQVKKNNRGAGRKEKFNNEQVEQILKARREGKSMRVIANDFNCSAGLVHKLIKNREG